MQTRSEQRLGTEAQSVLATGTEAQNTASTTLGLLGSECLNVLLTFKPAFVGN